MNEKLKTIRLLNYVIGSGAFFILIMFIYYKFNLSGNMPEIKLDFNYGVYFTVGFLAFLFAIILVYTYFQTQFKKFKN